MEYGFCPQSVLRLPGSGVDRAVFGRRSVQDRSIPGGLKTVLPAPESATGRCVGRSSSLSLGHRRRRLKEHTVPAPADCNGQCNRLAADSDLSSQNPAAELCAIVWDPEVV